jgi:hypothetical protein
MYHQIDDIKDITDIIELHYDKAFDTIEEEENQFKITLDKAIELLDFETDVPRDQYLSDLIFYLDELDLKKDGHRLAFYPDKFEGDVFYFFAEVK